MEQYFAFQWHITDSCDQRCQHCYIFSENHNISLQEMSYQDIQSVLDNCMEMCSKLKRIPYFYITGGDPLLHKNFWDLLKLLKSHNIAFSILGNPFHLSEEVCQKLKYYGCERYQLSIDGLRDTHDFMRKPGSFDTTIEKIRCIRAAGIKSVIMTTVSNTNSKEILEIIDLVVKNHVEVFAFARYCPTSFEKSTHIAPQEYKEFLQVCWEKFEEYKDSGTTFNLKDHLWTLFLYEKGLFTLPEGLDDDMIYDGCNCGNCHLTILPNGDVYACRRFESRVGNIYTDRLYDVFLGKPMDQYRQYNNFEKCSQCELRRFCRGCPAVTYGYTHNFYAADPQCWKEVKNI
ncbi:Putative mycofactocin radical SAM maturase MftC [Sporomusa silvacetica DSM 10669]|uniref:Mycofactocin radical SAM maturase MftC n=1 Tax=Sporomusa silvacetica DSM 10669 TaxID=1123289 RepID=A0ABZ3IG17_9FIRM|nr:radical SAM/SPASM domain protein, ACGX system [Sporomusa silvacetica]OZC16429.1 antilisterial bacteriocin subtilosin biosynthesis protein AlbA [Sporomusa silvacetica DSM 10669]